MYISGGHEAASCIHFFLKEKGGRSFCHVFVGYASLL